MNHLVEDQQKVLKQFIDRAGKLIENGYAYAFAHPEITKALQCESNKIQEIEKLFKKRPKQCYEKLLRDIYIRYFVMLAKLGLKYANHNPDYYNDVVHLQSFFKEYDCLKENQRLKQNQANYHNLTPQKDLDDSEDSTEKVFLATYQQLNKLINKVDSMKNRIGALNEKSREVKPKCVIRKSQDGMKVLNIELKERLRKIKQTKASRIRYFEDKDSDEISSEEMLNFNDLNQTPLSSFKPARAGPIQRNIVIPLNTNEHPKIEPKYFFKRDDNGKMTFDVKLNFENGLLYNDRLANGIYIENVLPASKIQKIKRKLF